MEDVLGLLVDPRAGHDAADLHLLGEGDQIGLDIEVLECPELAGHADTGLHFVEDEQCRVAVGELAQSAQETRSEVAVAALALDRLDDDRRHVALQALQLRASLSESLLLGLVEASCFGGVHRELDRR